MALRDGRGGQAPTIAAVDAGPGRLAVLLTDGWVALSTDAGAHLTVTPAPAGVDSVTHLSGQPAVLVVSTAAGNAAFVPGGPAWDLTPVPGGVHDLRSSRDGAVPVVLGHTSSSLYVRPVTAVDLRAPTPGGTAPGALTTPLRAGALRPVGPPSLLPADARVSVQPGTVRRLGYQLRLPPVAGPLDVYFLVDTTPSMREALDGLRAGVQGIVEDLARAQLDVQFGVGDFRDLDDLVTLDPARHAYRRDAPIGPAGPALSTALASLQIAAGGKDIPEAQTIALTQAATGAGMPGVVPVGQQAGFRPAATKVIVLITDAPFHQEPPYPSMAQTVADLHSRGIKVVSLAVNNDFSSTDPRPDERAVALGTATLAPVEGIDCQGTGTIDVPAGAPAVCPVDTAGGGPLSLAAPITALLRDVQDLGTVEVTVSGTGLLRTVGVTSEITNLAQPRPLTFALDLTCRPAQAGSSLALTLAGRVNGRPVVRTQAVVACLSVPALAVAALPLPKAPQQVLDVPPVGVPPGAPVSQGQPGAQPNANPNANPNVNPNIAGATAEQQQHQAELALALAEPDSAEVPDQVMAMVSRPRRSEHAALGVLAVALLMASVAGGLALRAGPRTAPVPARVRASHHSDNV